MQAKQKPSSGPDGFQNKMESKDTRNIAQGAQAAKVLDFEEQAADIKERLLRLERIHRDKEFLTSKLLMKLDAALKDYRKLEAQEFVKKHQKTVFVLEQVAGKDRLEGYEVELARDMAKDFSKTTGSARPNSKPATEKTKPVQENAGPPEMTGVFRTLDDLFSADLRKPEEILFRVRRGSPHLLVASTNVGKTSYMLNVCLKLAAGEVFPPLVVNRVPRRVLYLDFESEADVVQSDLQRMLEAGISDQATARKNFAYLTETTLDSKSLSLSDPLHWDYVALLGKELQVDLLIIDTLGAAFHIRDENSNAEVEQKVVRPSRQLARTLNCALIWIHHIGKANDTLTGEAAYRGRGASAYGAGARAVFTLTKEETKGPGYVTLSCDKAKGESFDPTLLRLDFDTRWFEQCAEIPLSGQSSITAQEIADFVERNEPLREKEIIEAFREVASEATIKRRIQEALRLGLILKKSRGIYEKAQRLTLYRDEPLSLSAEHHRIPGLPDDLEASGIDGQPDDDDLDVM
ncbi:MAG: AAA family ATPase [Acidobacteria bacterium]|nr:AAA family ATPase [Acidobacteriota bacterium]